MRFVEGKKRETTRSECKTNEITFSCFSYDLINFSSIAFYCLPLYTLWLFVLIIITEKNNDEGRQRRKRRRKSAVCEKMIEIILSEYLLMCKGWSECIAIDCGSHKLGWIQNNWIIYLNLDCTRHRKWKSRCTFYIAKPSADKRCYLLLLRTRPRGRALHNECLFSIIITVVGFTFIAASARILLQPL